VTAPAAGGADLHREADIGKAYDARLVRRLWDYIRPHRRIFWAAMICLPLTSACSLAQPYLLKIAIDRFIAQGDRPGLLRTGTLYGLAMVAEFGFLYLQYYLMMLVAQRSLAALRVDLVTHLQELPTTFFDRNPVGRLVTRLTTDVDVINEMFAAGALTILMDVATLLGIVAIMMTIDWHLAAVTLAVVPVVVVAINYFRVKARVNYRNIRDRLARLNAYLQESLSGMTVIQLFAREAPSQQRFDRLNEEFRDANHYANIYEAALFSIIEAISSIAIAVILWYGGYEIVAGAFAFGTLVAFIEYMQRFFVPLRDFSTKYAVMQSAMSSAERIFELLDQPVPIASPAVPRQPDAVRGGRARSRLVRTSARTVLRDVVQVAPARPSRWWADWSGKTRLSSCSTAATTSSVAACSSTASTCATGISWPCAATSASCCRTCFSSPARWPAT
jgi:ATP-binding cassette subfamily B protein